MFVVIILLDVAHFLITVIRHLNHKTTNACGNKCGFLNVTAEYSGKVPVSILVENVLDFVLGAHIALLLVR